MSCCALSTLSVKLNPPADYPFFITWIPQPWNVNDINSKNVILKNTLPPPLQVSTSFAKIFATISPEVYRANEQGSQLFSQGFPRKKTNSLESSFKLAANLYQYTPEDSTERCLRESRQMLCLASKSEKSPGPKETFSHLLMCTLKK